MRMEPSHPPGCPPPLAPLHVPAALGQGKGTVPPTSCPSPPAQMCQNPLRGFLLGSQPREEPVAGPVRSWATHLILGWWFWSHSSRCSSVQHLPWGYTEVAALCGAGDLHPAGAPVPSVLLASVA